ncbi:MAG: hypothetical protein E7466_00270 [Ruminococcaceae bacterium]|nr:hypothetical protein [Oscillospiraceae bacterium]
MLKIVFDENAGEPVVTAGGRMPEIFIELCCAVACIYRSMMQVDPVGAEDFKSDFQKCVASDKGLVWGTVVQGTCFAFVRPEKKEE